MNSIIVLLNAVKGSNIKVSITMNNGLTDRCYISRFTDANHVVTYKVFEYYSQSNLEIKDEKIIDVNNIVKVVAIANNNK